MRDHQHAKAVDDHNVWAYFARRFGLDVIGHMEPRPGIPPTTRHLAELVERMRAEHVRVILASAYYDPRHAQFLAAETGAKVLPLANQVGARAQADDYLSMIDYNVRSLDAAL
jgi:ABC-type Zn uptake system ZnuABC Zn-binding protein ZnuA